MEGYKVSFRNNKATGAVLLSGIDHQQLIGMEQEHKLDFLVVMGNDETDALKMADEQVHSFWTDYLGLA